MMCQFSKKFTFSEHAQQMMFYIYASFALQGLVPNLATAKRIPSFRS